MVLKRTDAELAKSIGRAIAKYRQNAGLTQAQVAEILNISNEAVSRMERGSIMPTVARLIQLANIFACEAADLLTESSNLVADQSKRLAILLSTLNESERSALLDIIESVVHWHIKNLK